MCFYIHYVCKDSYGNVVDQFDDYTNLVGTKKEAQKLRDGYLDVFNCDCKKGIWSARIRTLYGGC